MLATWRWSSPNSDRRPFGAEYGTSASLNRAGSQTYPGVLVSSGMPGKCSRSQLANEPVPSHCVDGSVGSACRATCAAVARITGRSDVVTNWFTADAAALTTDGSAAEPFGSFPAGPEIAGEPDSPVFGSAGWPVK